LFLMQRKNSQSEKFFANSFWQNLTFLSHCLCLPTYDVSSCLCLGNRFKTVLLNFKKMSAST
jgi:hypothetical protein